MNDDNPIQYDPNCIEGGEKKKNILTRNQQIRLPYDETSFGRTMSQ